MQGQTRHPCNITEQDLWWFASNSVHSLCGQFEMILIHKASSGDVFGLQRDCRVCGCVGGVRWRSVTEPDTPSLSIELIRLIKGARISLASRSGTVDLLSLKYSLPYSRLTRLPSANLWTSSSAEEDGCCKGSDSKHQRRYEDDSSNGEYFTSSLVYWL